MKENYDVIVCGLGGMGSATCFSLAKKSKRVLGLEQFSRGHDKGSSHGKTRLIRKAYFEHPNYVPLLQESYRLWRELEVATQRELLQQTGLLLVGNPKSEVLKGAKLSAKLHTLKVEEIGSSALAKRYPQFRYEREEEALFEEEAGFLRVEECVEAQSAAAQKLGADLHFKETLCHWQANKDGVTVETDRATYTAQSLVFAAGAWSESLLKDLAFPLSVHRQVQFWFSSPPPFSLKENCPCFAFDLPEAFFYGFPAQGHDNLKIASHKVGDRVADPTQVDRKVTLKDSEPLSNFISRHLPAVAPSPVASSVCLYTMTRDSHFLLDRHPHHANVFIAAGFSGHGFKFCPVVGEALAELATEGKTLHPIQFLKVR